VLPAPVESLPLSSPACFHHFDPAHGPRAVKGTGGVWMPIPGSLAADAGERRSDADESAGPTWGAAARFARAYETFSTFDTLSTP